MKVSIYDHVKVRLTEEGREILDQHNSQFPPKAQLKVDEDGFLDIIFHEFAGLFGESFRVHNRLPFEDLFEWRCEP